MIIGAAPKGILHCTSDAIWHQESECWNVLWPAAGYWVQFVSANVRSVSCSTFCPDFLIIIVVSTSWWRFIRIVAHENKGMYVCCFSYYKERVSYHAVRWCPLRLSPVRTWIHWQPAEDKLSGCSVCSCACAWVWVYVPESAAITIISSCVLVALVAPQSLCYSVWMCEWNCLN